MDMSEGTISLDSYEIHHGNDFNQFKSGQSGFRLFRGKTDTNLVKIGFQGQIFSELSWLGYSMEEIRKAISRL